MNSRKLYWVSRFVTIAFLISLYSCSSTNSHNPFYGLYSGFMTNYNNFVFTIKSFKSYTIEDIEDPEFRSIRKRIKVVDRNEQQLEYHYKSITIKGVCEYFFIIDKDTKRVVDWGVEYKENAMKFCTGQI